MFNLILVFFKVKFVFGLCLIVKSIVLVLKLLMLVWIVVWWLLDDNLVVLIFVCNVMFLFFKLVIVCVMIFWFLCGINDLLCFNIVILLFKFVNIEVNFKVI